MITSSDEPVWVSKVNPVAIILPFFFLSIGFCANLISEWNTSFLSEQYLPLDNGFVLISIFLLAAGLAFLIYKRIIPVYTLYQDRLVVFPKLKPQQICYLSDLTGWEFSESASRNSSKPTLNSLYLYFGGGKLAFRSILIYDLKPLRDFLHNEMPDKESERKNNFLSKFLPVYVVIIALMFGPTIGTFYFLDMINKKKGNEKVYMANLILSENPDFISHSHKNSATTYEMRLKTQQIKGFDFVISSLKRDEKSDMAAKLNKGDTVGIYILHYDYDIKLNNSKQPSFWDKHLGWHHIKIKGMYSPKLY